MSYICIFILMVFCHIIDDYFLQGILANMKQKSWWEDKVFDLKYKNDYIMALIMHSLSWSTMIHIPILISLNFNVYWMFLISWIINAVIHMIVDDLKANKLKINLIQDQSIHIIQIVITFTIYILGGFSLL